MSLKGGLGNLTQTEGNGALHSSQSRLLKSDHLYVHTFNYDFEMKSLLDPPPPKEIITWKAIESVMVWECNCIL
jgi:hypothetical protein